MSKHVNEYNPNAGTRWFDATNKVQTDNMKLKFNNILSCIAVCVCVYKNPLRSIKDPGSTWVSASPGIVEKLIGIHINVGNSNRPAEIVTGVNQIKVLLTGYERFDVYLVGPFKECYSTSSLVRQLKTLNSKCIYVFDTPLQPSKGAEIDFKIANEGTQPGLYYRSQVVFSNILKDKYDPLKGGSPITEDQKTEGRHHFANDSNTKPWIKISLQSMQRLS